MAGRHAGRGIIDVAFAAADASVDFPFEEDFVGIAARHGPSERNLVPDARGGKIADAIGKIERGWLGRAGSTAA